MGTSTTERHCDPSVSHVWPAVVVVASLTLPVTGVLCFPVDVQAAERERLVLSFEGPWADELQGAAMAFQMEVLALAPLEFAGNAEMERRFLDCASRIGVNATTLRECKLQAANRDLVEELLVVRAIELEDQEYEFILEVWSTESQALVFGHALTIRHKTFARSARSALRGLARAYLRWRGFSRPPPESTPDVVTPRTDIAIPV